MTPLARIPTLLRTRHGVVFLIIGGLMLIIGFAPSCSSKKRRPPSRNSLPPVNAVSSNAHFIVPRQPGPATSAPLRTDGASRTNRRPVIYSVHVDLPPDTNTSVRTIVAPFGRLLQCQLVITIESSMPNTPIVGLVTEDLWREGNLFIPAGSEVHGQALLDRTRERITSTGPWKIVRPGGDELTVTGVALDREFDIGGGEWGLTDGSAGIRGQVLRTDSFAEVKLFLATAISGMSEGLKQSRATFFGSELRGNARNAGFNAAGKVLDTYAEQILQAMKRDGIYVRVPAGKQFYIYVTQPIPAEKASETN